ncbi:TRAP transporter permease [Chloroflexota bacterium]
MRKGIDWTFGAEEGESPLQRFWNRPNWEPRTLLIGFFGVAIPFFVIFRGLAVGIDPGVERSLIVALLAIYVFLRFPTGRGRWNEPLGRLFFIDVIFILLVIATEAYKLYGIVVQDTSFLTIQLFGNTVLVDIIAGTVVIGLVFEAVRRSFGWITVIIASFFMIHSLFAMHFPEPLYGPAVNWTYLITIQYVLYEGVYGLGSSILLSMIFVFLLFGYMLVYTKGSAFFTSLANGFVGRYSGGPAKIAVLASGFVGGITGSGIANVATTGSVTIPLMKSTGYNPAFAGGVETAASSGSYFMPPVMGAAAFLIAAFTNIPYLQVCLAAAVPAVLYYLGVFVQVHFRAKKERLQGLAEEDVPSIKRVLIEGGHLLIPVIFIVTGLALGYSITRVAILSLLCVVLVSFVKKETRLDTHSLLIAFDKATERTAGIALCVISVGIIQGAILASGLGMRLSLAVELLAAGNMVAALIFAAIVCIILGMGVNPTLVYYIAYVFVIPALIKMGVPVLAAHLFALIFGGIANITPPVAVAAYTAASIAGAKPMRTAFQACKLGFAAYFVPFLLVFYPAMMIVGSHSIIDSSVGIITAAAGVICIGAAFEGWLLRGVPISQRILLFAAGGCLLVPVLHISALGLFLGALIILWQKFK